MTKIANILFPADYFDKNQPDQALRDEYEAAMSEPRFNVLLFDLESFEQNKIVKLNRQPGEKELPLLYRGWMLKPVEYDSLIYDLSSRKRFCPLTRTHEYESLHMFPYAYRENEELRKAAPKLLTFPDAKIDASVVNAAFERFMVKDYVKSAKQTSFPCCIHTPISQEEADALSEEFIRIRGDLFAGGIVCKEYIDLAKHNGATNEWRAFYLCGEVLNIYRNSNQPANAPRPQKEMVERFTHFNASYYTVDFAEKVNGEWMVIETGDGQVSGIAASQDPISYYSELADALEDRLPVWALFLSRKGHDSEWCMTPKMAFKYIISGGDFEHVKYLDKRMHTSLSPEQLKLWHEKKVEYLQSYDGRDALGSTLAVSRNFIIYNLFEDTWLTFKTEARKDVYIGCFYGDPYGAEIAPDESTCIIYGCGVIIYYLNEPFEEYKYNTISFQWFDFGDRPYDDIWVRYARYVDNSTIELQTDDDETITIDTQKRQWW